MNFYQWMRTKGRKKKLAESSARQYNRDLDGCLSQWAREANIIETSLSEISNPSIFEAIANEIRSLSIFIKKNKIDHAKYEAPLSQFTQYLVIKPTLGIDYDIDNINSDANITGTEKVYLIKARIGQGLYRQKLIDYWGKCSISEYSNVKILVASHIKPWSVCTNEERLDFYNGLLLLPNLDKLFDCGYISFNDDGGIILSKSFKICPAIGVNKEMSIHLEDKHKKYMKYHRDNVLIKI